MRFRFILLLCLSPMAGMSTSDLYFIDFNFKTDGGQLHLTAVPEPLISYKDIKDKRFGIHKSMMELSLDAPIRQIAFLLRTLNRNQSVLKMKGGELDILSIPFTLRVKQTNGEVLHEMEYQVTIGVTKNSSCIRYQDSIFDVVPEQLSTTATYEQFLKRVVFPFETYTFPQPRLEQFVVDLHFKWPELLVKESETPIFDLFPSAVLWNKGPITRVQIFLGSAFFEKNEAGSYTAASGTVLHHYADAHRQLKKAMDMGEEPTLEQLALYEETLHCFPINKMILERLMNAYLYHEMEEEALSLITALRPVFSVIKGGLTNQDSLELNSARKKNFLLGRKQFFTESRTAKVNILSPQPNDLLTGVGELRFELTGTDAPVLAAYCYQAGERLGTLDQEPWSMMFQASTEKPVSELHVVVYFENETYAEKRVPIRTIEVDQELSVHLVPLRVVASKGGTGFLTDLKETDFSIKENGVKKELAYFSREKAPLNIALLLDTSISMTGEKLDHAQYAIQEFISHLQAQDQVSLYTFDHQVMRLTDFTNNFYQLTPMVFNTCPQLSTSLYDACLAGIQALENQSGTRILVILSDGSDTGSLSHDRHVVEALQKSDIMVYSVVLPGDYLGQNNQRGHLFLKDLARLTGSVSKQISSAKGLDKAMKKIIEEFRGFYYLGYYSQIPLNSKRELDIDVKGIRAKVRYRILKP
ncbi:MAG: hypothetical protein CSA81_01765 [Acidobacteria bacterium]|nr:MAG: hypothetical protein CSA81_01765 [Acidobacteriota bacterium]